MLGSCSVFKWDLNRSPILLKQLKDWQELLRRRFNQLYHTCKICFQKSYWRNALREQNATSRNAAECRLKQKPNQSFLHLCPNTFFTRQQAHQPLTARGQAAELHLPLSHPCQVPDPRPTTRFSSGLSGLLSWKYSTAFWILSMQFKYSSSLPVGLNIKPNIKCSAPRSKERRYQESTRPNSG